MKGIIDSTLREGEQAVGVVFSRERKVEIVRGLSRVGVQEMEVGIASRRHGELAVLLARCREVAAGSRLALWCRCVEEDIGVAAALAPDILSLSIPVSDLHIEQRLGRDRQWVLDRLARSIDLALGLGIPFVSLGLEDATRAEPGFLAEVAGTAEAAGAGRLRLADTVGIVSPAEVTALVGRLRRNTEIPLGVHMHNDFGMATANSIAALEAGADWVDATVLGLGERAGNARLEELVGFLTLRRNGPYNTLALSPLCGLVADAAGREVPASHPIVGETIFSCETGLHLQGLMRNPATYEPYDPDRVGARREMYFGAKVGRGAVREGLAAMGLPAAGPDLEKTVQHLRELAEKQGYPLKGEEISSLMAGVGCGRGGEVNQKGWPAG